MIIRITVSDNDYGVWMRAFAKQIAQANCNLKDPCPSKESRGFGDWYYRLSKDRRFFREAIGKSNAEVSEDDKKRVIQIVTDSFISYTRLECDEDTAKYLQESFRCEIVDAVTDNWANGEDFYIFPGSCADKVLCF